MNFFGALAVALWFAYFSCLMYSFILEWKIIQAINRMRPDEKPLDMFSYSLRWGRHWGIFRIYRSLYPSGNLVRAYWLTTTSGILFVIGFIVSLCFAFK